MNVTTPEFAPIVGATVEPRAGLSVVRSPVALHVELTRVGGDGFPAALLGGIAFVQAELHRRAVPAAGPTAIPEGTNRVVARPSFDPALEAMQPALAGRLPVAFEAGLQREILRALDMAKEFKLSPIITGGIEADLAAAELKAANAQGGAQRELPGAVPGTRAGRRRGSTRVAAARQSAKDAGARWRPRACRSRSPAPALHHAADFVRNVARAVREGLSEEAALRALTLDAARIAGAADRVGSLEKGKIANVIVTSGDLFSRGDARPSRVR